VYSNIKALFSNSLNKENSISNIQTIFSIISGILLASAFTFLKLDWIAWFALIPFFYAMFAYDIKLLRAWKISFIFSFTFYIFMLTWMLVLHPLTWLGFSEFESILIVLAGWIGFTLIFSTGLSAFGLIVGIKKFTGWNRIFIALFTWVGIEYLQAFGIFGFTWGRLANSQFQNLPIIQSANLFGTLFITALIIFTNITLAVTIIDYIKDKKSFSCKYLVVTLVLLTLNSLYGTLHIKFKDDEGTIAKTAIIQGNIASGQKWMMSLEETMNIYFDLSYEAAKKEKIDLFVWPESAIPAILNEKITDKLGSLTGFTNSYLMTGIFNIKDFKSYTDYKVYNSIVAIDPNNKVLGVYAKRHLVPFGEYLPYRDLIVMLIPKVGKMNALSHDVSHGQDSGIITTPLGKIGGLICFESIFSDVAKTSVHDGAELLVIVTNDSWYKDSIGVYQHNAQAVFRAIEMDRYVIRAANTGLSTIISPTGEILKKILPLERGYTTENVKFRNNITTYAKFGDVIFIISLMGIILCLFLQNRINKYGNN